MKKVFASLLTASTFALLFTSCKKEALPVPNESAALMASAASANGSGGNGLYPVPVYVLTRYGQDSVIYGGGGRVAKVQHGAASYTQYSYGAGSVNAKTYSAGQLSEEVTYLLTPGTGLAYESEWHYYTYFNGASIHTQKWLKYEYNADGRMTKKYNKLMPFERTEYTWSWDAKSSLANIRFFGSDDKEYKKIEFADVDIKSKMRLHLPATGLDPYLTVLGKPNKDLPLWENHWGKANGNTTHLVQYHYYFEMDGNGYPVERQRSGGTVESHDHPVEVTPFVYKPSL